MYTSLLEDLTLVHSTHIRQLTNTRVTYPYVTSALGDLISSFKLHRQLYSYDVSPHRYIHMIKTIIKFVCVSIYLSIVCKDRSDKNREWLLTIKPHCKVPQTCVWYKKASQTHDVKFQVLGQEHTPLGYFPSEKMTFCNIDPGLSHGRKSKARTLKVWRIYMYQEGKFRKMDHWKWSFKALNLSMVWITYGFC